MLGEILLYKLFFEDNRPVQVNLNEDVVKQQKEIIEKQNEIIGKLTKRIQELEEKAKPIDIASFNHFGTIG